jgi:hypothetical protein
MPLALNCGPALDRGVALLLFLAVPDRRADELGDDLGELQFAGRRLAGFGVLDGVEVVGQVGEALGLQLLPQQPLHFGFFLLDIEHALDRALLDRRVAVAVAAVGDDVPAFGRIEGGGQHDVGELGHFRRVGDHVHEEGHFGQHLVPAVGAGGRVVEVVPRGEQHLGRAGILHQHVGHVVDRRGLEGGEILAAAVEWSWFL